MKLIDKIIGWYGLVLIYILTPVILIYGTIRSYLEKDMIAFGLFSLFTPVILGMIIHGTWRDIRWKRKEKRKI